MRNTQLILSKIVDYLTEFEIRIRKNNNIGLYDVNKLSQGFLSKIINIIYSKRNANFKDLDLLKHNYPAIDIADFSLKESYQITSQNDTSKIYETIEKFCSLDVFKSEEIKSLKFIILNRINWSDRQFQQIENRFIEKSLPFDRNKTIRTLDEFEEDIKELDVNGLNNLLNCLSEEFKSEEKLEKSEEILKGDIKSEIFSKVFHYYDSPWNSANSKAELNFKQKLKGKQAISYELLMGGKSKELIALWSPIIKNPLFSTNSQVWLDKPYFRQDIQAGKTDLFFAYAQLAHDEMSKDYFKKAISVISELVITPTYSLSGPSHDKLAPSDANFQNKELLNFMNVASDFLSKILESFGKDLVKKIFGYSHARIDSLQDQLKHKIYVLNSIIS